MSSRSRQAVVSWPVRRLLLTALTVVVLAACGSDDGGDAGPITSARDASTSTTAAAGDATSTTAAARTVEVAVSGGAPRGGVQHVDVPLGEAVVIRVEADEADEVHVHGYDLSADVAPGSPATIELTADIPGQFEVELEQAGLLLLELTVE